ncbi:MAG: peptidoglycan-binding domain-containing protein [Hyphomicrobiales bacterium]|nr:peptidoglycan-binding domain-containing protein [Hyphomicrobiales bacterium]
MRWIVAAAVFGVVGFWLQGHSPAPLPEETAGGRPSVPHYLEHRFRDPAAIAEAIIQSRTEAMRAHVVKVGLRGGADAGPPAFAAAKSEPRDDRASPAAVQTELKRLGCYAGRVDGVFGRGSRAALSRYNKVAGQRLASVVSDEALAALRSQPSGLCAEPASTKPAPVKPAVAAAVDPARRDARPSGAKLASAGESYLPPWMSGRATDGAEADAAKPAPVRVARAPKKPPANPRQAVAGVRSFSTRSFNFAWPGN